SGPEYLDGSSVDVGAAKTDGGCLALRRRPAEGGAKPPTAALTEDRCCERLGERRARPRSGRARSSNTQQSKVDPNLSPHPYLWPCSAGNRALSRQRDPRSP